MVFTVTDLTKLIDGVRTQIIWERDYSGGELVETEIALFAQDVAGNVWHFGEYPEEYEGGRFVKAPAWVGGYEGARVGIMLRADPQPGSPAYSQGFAPPSGQLGRSRKGVPNGAGHVRSLRVLRERLGDGGIRDLQAGCLPAEVLRTRRRQRPGRLARAQREGSGNARAGRAMLPGGRSYGARRVRMHWRSTREVSDRAAGFLGSNAARRADREVGGAHGGGGAGRSPYLQRVFR